MLTDMQATKAGIQSSGSTAATCLIKPKGSKRVLYTANCGDTRAVLCENHRARRLTVDHKSSCPVEMERIEQAGGFILRNRVMGILAVARSFGDAGLKPFVTALPHTSSTNLGPASQHPFFILACDGIWDVLEDQQAVDIVLDAMEHKQQDQASSILIRKALSCGSTDNITCMVVFL
jgi:serine/threonine protein phosphatase PrpC